MFLEITKHRLTILRERILLHKVSRRSNEVARRKQTHDNDILNVAVVKKTVLIINLNLILLVKKMS